jgi:hypothetical protein
MLSGNVLQCTLGLCIRVLIPYLSQHPEIDLHLSLSNGTALPAARMAPQATNVSPSLLSVKLAIYKTNLDYEKAYLISDSINLM